MQIDIPKIVNTINGFFPVLIPCAITLLVIICILLLLKRFGFDFKKLKKSKMTHLKKLSPQKAEGVVFGKLWNKLVCSPTKNEGHIIAFGGSGLGKTSAILIPTLRAWRGTFLAIDIAGDIAKNVDCPNKLVYEPANPQSNPYNIFSTIDDLDDIDDQNEALEQLALLLMPTKTKSNSDATEFFTEEGQKILTASLIAFYHQGEDFVEICETINQNSWQDLFNLIDATENKKAIEYINSFAGANEKNTAGCKQTVDKVLKLFATNEKVKKTLRRPDNGVAFAPKVLESKKVFVIIDDSKLKLYSPLLRIITAQCMEFFSTRENYKDPMILFALDEFASYGKMDIIEALRKLRKKNVRIFPLTQSLADLDLIYGRDERMAMMNNFSLKVVLGAADSDTQEYFSRLIGNKEVTKTSISKNANYVTTSESQQKERIVDPEKLGRLGNKIVLLHPDGHIVLKKNFYYKK